MKHSISSSRYVSTMRMGMVRKTDDEMEIEILKLKVDAISKMLNIDFEVNVDGEDYETHD